MGILIVAAHPDDEVLGCGGTIAALSQTTDVTVGILGEGGSSRYATRDLVPGAELVQLRSEAQAAAKIIGVSEVLFGGLPDNRFDTVPLLEIVSAVEAWIERLRPDVVYTHSPGDLNIDHTTTFRAVLTASRPMPECPVNQLYAFEIASSTEWAFQSLPPVFTPNTFVDITATMEDKVRALNAYQSEVRPFPHPRSPEAVRATARRWGSAVGVGYAEAFQLIRSVRRAS